MGTQTTITECRVGTLEGTSTYTCVPTSNSTQEWSPAVTAVCKGKNFRTAIKLELNKVPLLLITISLIYNIQTEQLVNG